MKAGYIFFSVLVISVLMVGLLPRLGQAETLSAPSRSDALSDRLPIVTISPPPVADAQAQPSREDAPPQDATAQPEFPARLDESNAVEPDDASDAGLMDFVNSVRSDQSGTVVGIYTPGLFAMPVTGQPSGDENYISSDENVLTQYATPARYGVIALLAHNYLNSGKLLTQLSPSQEVFVVFGDGKVARYRVSSVQYYQALSPHDTRSEFRDLNGPGAGLLSYNELFSQVYTTADRLVFQTCLEANGEPSWGRIFITADPAG